MNEKADLSSFRGVLQGWIEAVVSRSDQVKNSLESDRVHIQKTINAIDVVKENEKSVIEIKEKLFRKFKESQPLSISEKKYFWLNYAAFEQAVRQWGLKEAVLPLGTIEKLILKGWSFTAFENIGIYAELKVLGSPPSGLIKDWSDLEDKKKLETNSHSVVEKSLKDSFAFSAYLYKTTIFNFLFSSYLYNYAAQKNLIEVMDNIKVGNLEHLHIDKISDVNEIGLASRLSIAAILKEFRRADAEVNNSISIWLDRLKNILGDPRTISHRWFSIEEIEPEGYSIWLSSLNEEDIIFFFDNLENVIHPERRAFWLNFRRSARRIAIVLDYQKREKLKRKYAKDPKVLSIIERSFQFNSTRNSEQQLIIYFFTEWVFVEGSNTGFACQIFKQDRFKSLFKDSFYTIDASRKSETIRETSYESFRGTASGVHKALRHAPESPVWENEFLKHFSTIGVYRDSNYDRKLGVGKSLESFQSKSLFYDFEKTESTKVGTIDAKDAIGFYVDELRRHKAEVIDQRAANKVWVIYEPKFKALMDTIRKKGFHVRLLQEGCRQTGMKMAWQIDL